MNGTVPDSSDFQFIAGGFKCAVGIQGGVDYGNIVMTKEKIKGGGTESNATWEHVLLWPCDEAAVGASPFNGDHRALISAFLVMANMQLADAIGGNPTIPDMPADHYGKLIWLCKYKLSFDGNLVSLNP